MYLILTTIADFIESKSAAYPVYGCSQDRTNATGLWDWLINYQTSNLVTLLLAGAGIFAYLRWEHDRRVKRIELLMERLRSFDDSPGAQNAVMMLYNHDRMIPLWSTDEPPERRYVRVKWEEVELALIPQSIYPMMFNTKLSAIRDCFEDYLNKLAQLWIYLELGVIKEQDARKIMAPWLRRFGLMEHRTKVMRNLIIYIRWRKLDSVQSLFARFGVDLNANVIEDWKLLDHEVNGEAITDAYEQLRFTQEKAPKPSLGRWTTRWMPNSLEMVLACILLFLVWISPPWLFVLIMELFATSAALDYLIICSAFLYIVLGATTVALFLDVLPRIATGFFLPISVCLILMVGVFGYSFSPLTKLIFSLPVSGETTAIAVSYFSLYLVLISYTAKPFFDDIVRRIVAKLARWQRGRLSPT